MGLFSFLGRSKGEAGDGESADAGPAGDAPEDTSWHGRLRGVFDFEREGEAPPLVRQLLQELGQSYEGAKVKAPDDFDDMELRARSDGTAFRVIVDVSTGWLSLEMKFANRVGPLDLSRDHDKVPKHREPDEDDPWADEDEVRVFVAKGIYVEGDEDDVNGSLTTLAQLPAELSSLMLAEMERAQMSSVSAHSDGLTIRFDPNLDVLADPIATICETVAFMKTVTGALATGDRDMAAEPKVIIRGPVEINGQLLAPTEGALRPVAVHRVSCSYCSSHYVPVDPAPACPNCGAPLGR